MTTHTNKAPWQVAMTKRELFDALMKCGGERRATSDDWLEPFAAAVLAHAAPKWHPVSELVPDMDASYHVGSLTYGNKFENKNIVVGWQVKHHPYGYTHWSGPIEPPKFEEKP